MKSLIAFAAAVLFASTPHATGPVTRPRSFADVDYKLKKRATAGKPWARKKAKRK
jgi:hypothetical protein